MAGAEAAAVPVMVSGQPNPGGTGRYCMPPPGTCYCRDCPHYRPLAEPNWAAVEGSREWLRLHGAPSAYRTAGGGRRR